MSLVKFSNRNATPYFNNVLDSLFTDTINNNYGLSKMPQVNISENEKAYFIELAAPGLDKQEFKIELKKDTLFISAEKNKETSTEQKKFSRKEFDYLSFSRSFLMPEDINAEKISAEYTNGILQITIAKMEPAKEISQSITVS